MIKSTIQYLSGKQLQCFMAFNFPLWTPPHTRNYNLTCFPGYVMQYTIPCMFIMLLSLKCNTEKHLLTTLYVLFSGQYWKASRYKSDVRVWRGNMIKLWDYEYVIKKQHCLQNCYCSWLLLTTNHLWMNPKKKKLNK